MKSERISPDVAIIGSGVAGLFAAKELAKKGIAVAVFEKHHQIASGATTKNEGWLHAGTYHAVSVTDEQNARQVVERSKFGHDYIATKIPECIENPALPTYALISDEEILERAEKRWQKFDINRTRIPLKRFSELAPEIAEEHVQAAFEVSDTSINTRILCNRLVSDITRSGGKIFTNAEFSPHDEEHAVVIIDGKKVNIKANLFIVTAGPQIKQIFEKMTGQEFPMRFLKSHLLVMPRLIDYGAFFIDEGEAGVMNHGATSVVGINRDGIHLNKPDYEIVKEKQSLLSRAVEKMIPHARNYRSNSLAVACIKPDVYQNLSHAVNLNVTIDEPVQNFLYAVPGKMTESPYLAKSLLDIVDSRITAASEANQYNMSTHRTRSIYQIKMRPCDVYQAAIS